MRRRIRKFLAYLIVAAGLCAMAYPWISNWLYEHGVDSTVEAYNEAVESAAEEDLSAEWEAALEYNAALQEAKVTITDPFTEEQEQAVGVNYDSVLNLYGNGLMCFIEIPKIDVYLPVYHGTSEAVLEKGVGHLEGSALPVGGTGTRPILSAHTGINSKKLFTDLTELEEGDFFFLYVLDEVLAYQVCEIQIIEPADTAGLVADSDRDLVSLVTCTPYGVNSHRLVVTGERTEYTEELAEEVQETSTEAASVWMQAYRRAILIGLAIVAAISILSRLIGMLRRSRGRRS